MQLLLCKIPLQLGVCNGPGKKEPCKFNIAGQALHSSTFTALLWMRNPNTHTPTHHFPRDTSVAAAAAGCARPGVGLARLGGGRLVEQVDALHSLGCV